LAIIEYIPQLAEQLGVDFFNEKLATLCMTFIGDCVFSIRQSATKNLKKLTEVFGDAWFKSHILPKVIELAKHSNYLYRMTTLFSINTLATTLSGELIVNCLLPIVIELVPDRVANIRLNVAKTFQTIIPLVDNSVVETKIKPALSKLLEDKDRDVKYFSNIAIQYCNQKMT